MFRAVSFIVCVCFFLCLIYILILLYIFFLVKRKRMKAQMNTVQLSTVSFCFCLARLLKKRTPSNTDASTPSYL